MSDTFVLCPKCGEELDSSVLNRHYYCVNCDMTVHEEEARKETIEYLKGEEDEKG